MTSGDGVSVYGFLVQAVPPDGKYRAFWSGFTLQFEAGGREWRAHLGVGMKGHVACTITIKAGRGTIDGIDYARIGSDPPSQPVESVEGDADV